MKRWMKVTLTLVVLTALTVALYFVGFQGDWIKPLVEGTGAFGYIIFLLIMIPIVVFMCFVPATTFTFTLLGTQLFGAVPGFIVCAIGCWISSMIMFTIGDKAGEPLVDWMIGKESRIKTQNMISDRATVLVPFMLLFPFFPDDAICMVAGLTKMKYWYFGVTSALTRTIGIGVTAFLGSGVLDYASFGVFEWIVFINMAIIDVVLVWCLSGILEKWLKKYRSKKEQKKLEELEKLLEEEKQDAGCHE